MVELQSLPDLLAGQFQRTIDWIRNPQLQVLTLTDVILAALVAFGLISIGLIAFKICPVATRGNAKHADREDGFYGILNTVPKASRANWVP